MLERFEGHAEERENGARFAETEVGNTYGEF